MQAQYHVAMTKAALGDYFNYDALEQVVSANVSQDSLASIFGGEPYRHFCDRMLENSFRYIEREFQTIASLARKTGEPNEQRAAFGRLLHTVQDFYAHSNYIDLWLSHYQQPPRPGTPQIEALDHAILHHPDLRIGEWVPWRDLIYYIPVLGDLTRAVWVPVGSHEAMHLDSPDRGPRFTYAIETARRRTLLEYRRVIDTIRQAGGDDAIARFLGRPLAHASPTASATCRSAS